MFIDLWLCKGSTIQNTLPKAKNTKANFLAFALKIKEEKKGKKKQKQRRRKGEKKKVQAASEAAI